MLVHRNLTEFQSSVLEQLNSPERFSLLVNRVKIHSILSIAFVSNLKLGRNAVQCLNDVIVLVGEICQVEHNQIALHHQWESHIAQQRKTESKDEVEHDADSVQYKRKIIASI